MSNKIEELCIRIIDCYNNNMDSEFSCCCDKLVKEISTNTYQFTRIQPNYIVSKALFYSLCRLDSTHRYYKDTFLVTYYSLLCCIHNKGRGNKENLSKVDSLAASALAFLLIDKTPQIIGDILINGHLISSIEGSVQNVIAQTAFFYFNYKYAPTKIFLDENISKLLETTKNKWEGKFNAEDEITQNKVRSFVEENNDLLIEHLECILLDLNSNI